MFLNFDEFALLFIILLLLFSFLRLCWPPFDQKTDTEFRKHCYEWLKKISVSILFLEDGNLKKLKTTFFFFNFMEVQLYIF